MADKLKGRNAVVTGAGRGIGRAVAILLAQEGASVVVNDPGGNVDGTGHDAGPADQVVDEIKAASGIAVANYDSVAELTGGENMVKQCADAFGRIDILVNVAGVTGPIETPVWEIERDDYLAVLTGNVIGTFLPIKREQVRSLLNGEPPAVGSTYMILHLTHLPNATICFRFVDGVPAWGGVP